MSDPSTTAVEQLPEKWRKRAEKARKLGHTEKAIAVLDCADELEERIDADDDPELVTDGGESQETGKERSAEDYNLDRETPPGMVAWEEWMAENGIAGHGGRRDGDEVRWGLDIPDDAEISVNMQVTLPDGRKVTWGGSNEAARYELVKKAGDRDE